MDGVCDAVSDPTLAFLAGGGEMGARSRDFDWSQTPVGAAATWPQSLKTVVRIMLGSRFAMWLGWGPDLTFFYNDAYAGMTLGPKHPWALGKPAREVWSEVWNHIHPRAEMVLGRGEATWDEGLLLFLERNGFSEETYHTFSYSPVPDDHGGVGGMLCVVTEDTKRTIGERRLKTLRELAARTTQSTASAEEACQAAARTMVTHPRDVPFCLLYLLDGEHRAAHLAGCTGLEPETQATPRCINLVDPHSPWPFAESLQSGETIDVDDLIARFGPLPGSVWPESPRHAVVLPMAAQGQSRVSGFVVAGISPRLELTDDYRGFLDLMTAQIATAVANARALADEKRRVEALAELDRAKTDFFSNVSHEFRTPLTLMLGPIDDILSKHDDNVPSDERHLLEVVNRNGQRLLRLVNTLLDFSRIEAGRVKAQYQPTNLAALTTDLVSGFRSACERAGLQLVLNCQPISEPVYVDREMWEKIVLNLLSNAFKFTFEGSITVSLRQLNRTIEFQVHDTGAGIPADEIPKLFERFHRVRNAKSRSHEGSGIGLALVQELVRLHGATIHVESVLGLSTTFTIQLPLGRKHLSPDQIVDQPNAVSNEAGSTPFLQEALRWLPADDLTDQSFDGHEQHLNSQHAKSRVLVVDDNVDMRQYVARLLSQYFDVQTVNDGEAALHAIRQQLPDLVLTDVMMPRLNGFELINALRADPATSSLPIIMLSARAGEESRVEGIRSGADDYLVKPFSARELIARVTAHLQMARLRQEANDFVRQSDQRLQMALAASRMVTWQMNRVTGNVDFSGNASALFGLPAGCQHIGLSEGMTIVHPEDQQRHRAEIEAAMRNGGSYVTQFRVIRPDNKSLIWIEERGQAIVHGPGEVGLIGVDMDVTAAKQGEQRVRLLWEAAAVLLTTGEPDVMLRNLFDKIGPHFGLDTYFNFMVNEAGTGLQLASCTGIPADVAAGITTLEFGQAVCGTVALLRRPIVATQIQQSDDPKVQLVKSFGIRAYACNPLLTGNQLLGTLSFASRSRDQFDEEELDFLQTICQYVTAAYERLRLINRLREADRRKDEFLATLAHELRNPLAPLRNGLQIMKHAASNVDAIEEARSVMERQLAQMVRLVDDLLDMSRISRGKINLRREPIELAGVIQQAVETSRPMIERARHKITMTMPSESLIVDGDATRLAQVFSNLLNNAAKYSDPSGHITLTVERDDQHAVVKVRDMGIGIPADMLPRVFEMFTQVDRSLEKSQGGLGIGLSLVKGLVEMHDGSVEAFSGGSGMGSEFVVRLPVSTIAVGANGRTDPSVPLVPSTRRRIMIVDDNRDAANSLAMMLKMMGNETLTAHDGLQALDLGETFRPDVALLDIGMPRLNGYDTAIRMRQQAWGREILLVALTGWGQEDDRRRSQEAGFNHHLVKPLDFAALDKLLSGLHIIKA